MKVSNLIKELQKFDPEFEVLVEAFDGGESYNITCISTDNYYARHIPQGDDSSPWAHPNIDNFEEWAKTTIELKLG